MQSFVSNSMPANDTHPPAVNINDRTSSEGTLTCSKFSLREQERQNLYYSSRLGYTPKQGPYCSACDAATLVGEETGSALAS
jgi:hypothetical protein